MFCLISKANSGWFEIEQGSWLLQIAGGDRDIFLADRGELYFGVLKIALQKEAAWDAAGVRHGG